MEKDISFTFTSLGNLKKMIITQQIDLGRAKNNLQVRRIHSKVNKERNDVILRKQKALRENRYIAYCILIVYLYSILHYYSE